MSKGLHGDNLRWLDPFGHFPNKEPVIEDENDQETHARIMRKLRGTEHLKLLYHRYSGEYAEEWYSVQAQRWASYINVGIKTLTIRVIHNGLAAAPETYATYVQDAALLAESIRGGRDFPIWFEIGNEPNLAEEGWDKKPETFNKWFIAVVNVLRESGFGHGIFYPGLSPNQHRHLGWYSEPSTIQAMDYAQGIAGHLYQMIVDEYIEWWSALTRLGWDHYPKILSEVGATRPDRMSALYPLTGMNVSAYHVFIAEGQANGAWPQAYELSEAECQLMESW